MIALPFKPLGIAAIVGVAAALIIAMHPPMFIKKLFGGLAVDKGEAAPDLIGVSLDGVPVYLEDYRGKVVVLNFWATWCPHCKREFPELEEINQKFKSDKFELFAVDVGETAETVKKFLKGNPLQLTVLVDPEGKVVETYGVRGIPRTVLIDPQGQVHRTIIGYSKSDFQRLKQEIEAFLSEG